MRTLTLIPNLTLMPILTLIPTVGTVSRQIGKQGYKEAFKDSLAAFQAASALAPSTFALRISVAEGFQSLERHDEAILAYRECLRINPTALKPANDLGLYLHGLGLYQVTS